MVRNTGILEMEPLCQHMNSVPCSSRSKFVKIIFYWKLNNCQGKSKQCDIPYNNLQDAINRKVLWKVLLNLTKPLWLISTGYCDVCSNHTMKCNCEKTQYLSMNTTQYILADYDTQFYFLFPHPLQESDLPCWMSWETSVPLWSSICTRLFRNIFLKCKNPKFN